MKKIYSFIFIAISSLLCFSCTPDNPNSGNNEGGEGPNPPAAEKLTIIQSTTVIEADGKDAALFTVMLGEKVITEGIKFYDKNNAPIELPENKFTTTVAGKYTFWAAYETYQSDKFAVEAVDYELPTLPADPQPEATSFFKKMLTIYFTGTDCPNCPSAKNVLHSISEDPDYAERFILTAAHTYNPTDPAYLSQPINNACAVSSYPTVVHDMYLRVIAGGVSEDNMKKIFDEAYAKKETEASISASSEVTENGQILIKAAVKSAINGDLRAGVFLLEDSIEGDQKGATKEEDNIHDNCIRTIVGRQSNSDFTGESLGSFIIGQEKAFMFTPITIKEGWVKEKLKLVVYVSSYSKEENSFIVTNCAALPLDGTVAYIYK